ncbi:MAG: hypothetical protein WAM14_14100 [Candidatus Nitrosopolaris sp.]
MPTPEPHSRVVSQEIAKKVGISHATFERAKKIIDKGNEQQKNALRKGDVGIRKIYSQLRREEKRIDLPYQSQHHIF